MSSFSRYGINQKSTPSPAPLKKLNEVREGKSNIRGNLSISKTGPTSFKINRGKPPDKIPSLLKLDNKTRSSSSPSTNIDRSTTPIGKTRFVISPKPNERPKSRGRSIFSPTDNEVYDINNSILRNDSVAHNSDLSKKSPPQIKGKTPTPNRKNSLEDDNSEAFRKTPVGKEHLRKSAQDFEDPEYEGHLTPLGDYPIGSSSTNDEDIPISNDEDNLFEDLFNFSRDDQYEIEGPFTEEISEIDHQLFELQRRENKLLKRKIELQERNKELQKRNKKNPCRSTKRAKTGGRGRGRGRGGSRSASRRGGRKKGNTLMDVMKQLKF